MKMRRFYTVILLIAIASHSFSQVIEKDTVTIEVVRKITKSRWGMRPEIGVLFHQMPDQNHIKNQLAYAGGISIFYNQLFVKTEIFNIDFKPQSPIFFDDYLFSTDSEFNSINFNFSLGYNFNFNSKWGSELEIGVNATDFSFLDDRSEGYYNSEIITGGIFGISLDRYIKFKTLKYLVVSLKFDYYTTDYKIVSRDLNKGSLNYSLTVSYKFWYTKTIK